MNSPVYGHDDEWMFGGKFCGDDCFQHGHWGSKWDLGGGLQKESAEHCAEECRATEFCRAWTYQPSSDHSRNNNG